MYRLDIRTKSLAAQVKAFGGIKVLVIGEAMLDCYLEGSTGRICREAPVPVVSLENRTDAPGGAANTAVNVRCLSGDVIFLSVIGDDHEGEILRGCLEKQRVSTDYLLVQPQRQTLTKNRVIAAGQMLVRFDQGHTEAISPEIEQQLINQLIKFWPQCEAIIVSDYGYGILTPRIIDQISKLQRRQPRVLVADAKSLPTYKNVGITACKPNFEETKQLLGVTLFDNDAPRAEVIAKNADRLLDITGAKMVAVTLDTEGAMLLEQHHPPYRTYAQPSPNSRAAGAGDTFVSALTLALAAKVSNPTAIEIASAAAAVVVAKDGTSSCSDIELQDYFAADGRYVHALSWLTVRVEMNKRQNKKIVFTNGCFDILHRGHIAFLNQAKALGDLLIVAVNSDDSVRRLKGEGRPINSLEDRVQVLEALSCIDYLIAFDEDTADHLIEAIRPDVFVKGGDYTADMIAEAALVKQYGGSVEILPYLPDRSTSNIIERIREVLEAQPKDDAEPDYATTPDFFLSSANTITSGTKFPNDDVAIDSIV